MLSASASTVSAEGPRKVRVSDVELYQRVARVAVPSTAIDLEGLSVQRGWKHTQCQVIIGGHIEAQTAELLALLRAPSESESNALLRSVYGSRFIYSSLVHSITSSDLPSGQQLMVRTASFSGTRRLNPFRHRSTTPPASESQATNLSRSTQGLKNVQCCYIELLTPTPTGFKIVFRSLSASEVTVGKAPPERVVELHPISGWFTAEPTSQTSGTLRITFQAGFPGMVLGGCDVREAQTWLQFVAKGVCRLQKVLRRRHQHVVPGRVRQAFLKPFQALGVSETENSEGTHHNWHCIACTRGFLPALSKTWRRCDLCAYRVCASPPCCSDESVAIYSRYVASLLVCARCLECINLSNNGSTTEDVRYAGLSLQFTHTHRENVEPELELDPFARNRDRWGSIASRRSSTRSRAKRRALSDPPPVLGLVLSSSGEFVRS